MFMGSYIYATPSERPAPAPAALQGGNSVSEVPNCSQVMELPNSLQERQSELSSTTSYTLEDLQPDVLYHVLLFLGQQDVAYVKMCSSRLRSNILRACQHWAPKVESWLMSDPSSAQLLKQLRGAGSQGNHNQPPAQAAGTPTPTAAVLSPSVRLCLPQAAATSANSLPTEQLIADHEPEMVATCVAVKAPGATQHDAAGIGNAPRLLLPKSSLANTRLDWRQVWSCLERAQQGPWQFDVRRLTPAASPHGVLLTFELLLQQPAPPAGPGSCDQQAIGWRDSVTVLNFVLDGKVIDITVDASGRVSSPQKDWCQGNITLQVGQPKLLALEVSYIFPVPAWFLHPCTLAAPRVLSSSSSFGGSSSSSSCASSMSGATPDPNWDSYSTSTSSSLSIAHSIALSSAVSSFTSATGPSGPLGSSSAGAVGRGRPRLCLDLAHGFGSYIHDPRYLDDATINQVHRGLERLELAGRVCWRPSKVQSWLGRLLPGIRGHACSTPCSHRPNAISIAGVNSNNSTAGSSTISNSGSGSLSSSQACGGGSSSSGTGKPGLRPSFSVSVSKAAVWQVPEDPEFRFTSEGFMFWAVQHKAEQLLEHYGILSPVR